MSNPTIRYVPFEEVRADHSVIGPPDFHYFVINRRRCVYSRHSDSVFRAQRGGWFTDGTKPPLPHDQAQLAKAYLRLLS